MTAINKDLHDMYLAAKQASRDPNFPDFPRWLASIQRQAGDQIEVINGRKSQAEEIPASRWQSIFGKH